MEIHAMNRTHLEQIAKLESECFVHPWSYNSLEEYLGNPSAYFYVALSDEGELMGYVGSYIVADEAYVTNVAVSERFRRMGVGAELVKTVSENARSNRASFISLEVRLSNTAAIELYKKAGFDTAGIRPKFYRDPEEDALIMTKRFERG